ncbi:MAG: hypothetical protein ISS45_11340 [Candidatus Omnitrophica bacterium]|nr:hypothetical protein [Candidatus Omnitrophota bacterium]
MEFENQTIKCSKFWETESVIKKTEAKISEAGILRERRYYAQDILLEAEDLLSCLNYNSENPDCFNCHSISRGFASHRLISLMGK